MKTTVIIQEDTETGELVLPFTNEMMEAAGLKIGDTIRWVDNENGSWSIVKVPEEKEWVLVDVVQQFHMQYMVQVPKGKAEWALDTVTMKEAKEFSQRDMGEVIMGHRVMTEEDALQLCEEQNTYCRSWTNEQLLNAFFTKDGEKVEL
jgi:hypothetical protein